ncbi:hypothetical protein VTP01DRAFT_4361 [Rhizomucor pusillus]|uniref:uncharacterized protein n=1 Tax=Rhizomucor pusillus TaxID=4840 RepID=UPI003743472E
MDKLAVVHFDEEYTHNAVVKALKNSQIAWNIQEHPQTDSRDSEDQIVALQWLEYELIDWPLVSMKQTESLVNAYCIRKGLIRKAQLSYNVNKYLSKNPDSILKQAIPETWMFELDHVDYFDEAMNDVFEVERDLRENETRGSRHMFIIKPSLANKAAGIHVFDSMDALYSIFDKDSDDEADSDDDDDESAEDLSQVREWVIQRYIANPLLVNHRKFHVRAYALAVSNIQVYLYRDMLALFALKEYNLDTLNDSLVHLSNTCIQAGHADFVEDDSVCLFWDLVDKGVTNDALNAMFTKMQEILKDIFDACTSEVTTFQAIPNAFELFGIDFLVDDNLNVYFLEANAYPDFKQTGTRLQHLIQELFEATVTTAVEPFFGKENTPDPKFVKVLDKQLLRLE